MKRIALAGSRIWREVAISGEFRWDDSGRDCLPSFNRHIAAAHAIDVVCRSLRRQGCKQSAGLGPCGIGLIQIFQQPPPRGSNNDTAAWTSGFEDAAAHLNEVTQRTAADIRWLETAFKQAKAERAKAVVVIFQADMWDPAAFAAGGAGLNQYTPFVQKLADLSVAFSRPVLVMNGDTHLFLADQPLANPASLTGVIHHTQPVPNLTRIVVQGAASGESGNAPAEWLRVTIDPRKSQPFSWSHVATAATPW